MGLAAVKEKLASGPSDFEAPLRLIEIASLAADALRESRAANDELAEESYYDGESRLFYGWGRYWDPKIGRSLTPDRMSVAAHVARWQASLGSLGQIPLEINSYAYVANNPLRWTDPTGLFVVNPANLIGVGGSAGVQGSFHFILVGGNVSQQFYGDMSGNACAVTQVCMRFGPGLFAGAGGTFGGSYGASPTPTPILGSPSSIGGGFDFGTGGPAVGGSVQFGDGSIGAGSGWGGAGLGFSGGVDVCWTPIVKGNCGCNQ